MRMANTAIIPPSVRLPVSPMNTCAGKELYQRKPMVAPMNAAANTTNSALLGMYMMLR